MLISEKPGGGGTIEEAVAETDDADADTADATAVAAEDAVAAALDDDDPGMTCWMTRGRMTASYRWVAPWNENKWK